MAELTPVAEKFMDMDMSAPEAGRDPPKAEEPAKEVAVETAVEVEIEVVKEPEKEAEKEPEKEPEKEGKPSAEEKAYITREKNRRKTVEDALAATQAQLSQALTALNRYIPDPNAIKPEPKADSFTTTDEYIEARSDWLAERKLQALEADRKHKADQLEGKKLQDSFVSKLQASEAKLPGISDLMNDPTFYPFFNNDMAETIKTAEDPAAVLHYLDENREELERISKLRPARATAELGKIEVRIATPKPTVTTSKAPKPVSPVGASGGIVRGKYDPGITDAEYFAIVEQEKNAKLAQMRGATK